MSSQSTGEETRAPSAPAVEQMPTPRPPLRVLLTTDGSAPAGDASGLLRELDFPAGSAVRVLSVAAGPELPHAEWALAAQRRRAEQAVQAAAATLAREGLELSTEVRCGAAAAQVIAAGREFGADLVAVGSQGRSGLQGLLLGSVARNVAHHAGRPVLAARPLQRHLRKVLLAVDGSDHSREAIRFTARLPLPAAAEVVVCSVYRVDPTWAADPMEMTPDYTKLVLEAEQAGHREATSATEGACRELRRAGLRARCVVQDGDPGDHLLTVVEAEGVDLVIAGARGESLLKGLGIGSVADRLLRNCPASVLLVHQPE